MDDSQWLQESERFQAKTSCVKAAPNLVSFGPVDLVEDGIFFHTVNEQMPVASLTRNAVLFADVLQKLIQAEQAPRR